MEFEKRYALAACRVALECQGDTAEGYACQKLSDADKRRVAYAGWTMAERFGMVLG